jgi:hypothetical protein
VTDPRTKLLQQMRELRARMDPEVLETARRAAEAAQMAKRGEVPIDKEAARTAVSLFLQRRADNGRFAIDLMERLKNPGQAAKAYEAAAQPRQTVVRQTQTVVRQQRTVVIKRGS